LNGEADEKCRGQKDGIFDGLEHRFVRVLHMKEVQVKSRLYA
jgi:hypothetical protein